MRLTDWFKANKLTVNINKTVFILFGNKNEKLENISISEDVIDHSENTKLLGLWIDENLNWTKHCNTLITKLKRNLALVHNTRNLFNQSTLKLIYHAHLQSHINYGLVIWGGIQWIQLKCLKYTNNKINYPQQLKLLNIEQLVKFELAKLGYRLQNSLLKYTKIPFSRKCKPWNRKTIQSQLVTRSFVLRKDGKGMQPAVKPKMK